MGAEKPVVTISATYGAGGGLVGPRVAERLGVTFWDRAIPASVAAVLAEPPDELLAVEDDLGRGFSHWISFFAPAGAAWTGIPLPDVEGRFDEASYKEHISLVLRHEAERGAVILGRGAAIVLAEHPRALHVRLDGPVERRIAQVMDLGGLDERSVRFIGGGLAPYVAAKLAAHFNVHVPFYLGAVAVVLGIVVLTRGHSLITAAERAEGEEQLVTVEPVAVVGGTAPAVSPSRVVYAPSSGGRRSPIVVAVDDRPGSGQLCASAADLAEALDCPVEILHVVETDLAMDQAIETEDTTRTAAALKALVDLVVARGVSATGHLLEVVGDHGDVGRRVALFADQQHARMIIAGAPTHGPLAGLLDASATAQLARHTHCDLHIVHFVPPA